MEVKVADKHGMPCKFRTLCSLQHFEGSLELDASQRSLVERLEMARRHDEVVWNAGLG